MFMAAIIVWFCQRQTLSITDIISVPVHCHLAFYIFGLVDDTIPKQFQSTNDDYYGSGFDRGHLAAAANHRYSFLICN